MKQTLRAQLYPSFITRIHLCCITGPAAAPNSSFKFTSMAPYGEWMKQEPVVQLHHPAPQTGLRATVMPSGPKNAQSIPVSWKHTLAAAPTASITHNVCRNISWKLPISAAHRDQSFWSASGIWTSKDRRLTMEPPQHRGTLTTPLFLMEKWEMLGFPHGIIEWLTMKGTLKIVYFQPYDRKTSSPTSSLKQIHGKSIARCFLLPATTLALLSIFLPTIIHSYSIFTFGHRPVLILTVVLILFYYFSALGLHLPNMSLP